MSAAARSDRAPRDISPVSTVTDSRERNSRAFIEIFFLDNKKAHLSDNSIFSKGR